MVKRHNFSIFKLKGWGKLGDHQGAGLGTQLQETKVRVKPIDYCTVNTARIVKYNSDSMLCAHSPNTDACNVIFFFIENLI